MNLKVENKFGNFFTTDHTGEVEFNVSNGDFQAHDLSGKSRIELQFSNAMISKITNGKININYSELDLEQSENLNISSKSSTVNLEHSKTLIVDSKRDKYNLVDVISLNLNSSFTYFTLNTLKSNLSAQTKYGNLEIITVNLGFRNINIEMEYTNVKASFPRGTSYRLDLTYCKSKLIYPEQLSQLEKTTVDPKEEIYRMYGIVGKSGNPTSKIKISAKSGEVSLFHK